MSADVKRTAMTLIAAMLISAFSSFFAIIVARLIRDHHTDHASHPAATDRDASTAEG